MSARTNDGLVWMLDSTLIPEDKNVARFLREFSQDQTETLAITLAPPSIDSPERNDLARQTRAHYSDAVDYITTLQGYNPSNRPESDVLCVLHPKDLSLRQLATIGNTVSVYDRPYALFYRQCYWFAAMFMGVAMLHDLHPENAVAPDEDEIYSHFMEHACDIPPYASSPGPSVFESKLEQPDIASPTPKVLKFYTSETPGMCRGCRVISAHKNLAKEFYKLFVKECKRTCVFRIVREAIT